MGLEDGRFSIFFEWQPDRNLDLLYIKIFVTKEKTDFGFLTQWDISAVEDNLRGASTGTSFLLPRKYLPSVTCEGFRQADCAPSSTNSELGDTETEVPTNSAPLERQPVWASRLIILVPRYVVEAHDGSPI